MSRVDRGRLSTTLVRETRPGDVLRLGAAGGQLTFRREDRPASLIAAGTGWAPIRALLEDLAERPPIRTYGSSWWPGTARTSTTAR